MSPEEIEKLPYRPCVGIVLTRGGEVFAAQRIDNYKDAWQMPQGGVDPGENPRDAALRELGEETSVPADLVTIKGETEDWIPYELPHDLVPKLWNGRFRGQEQKWFVLEFHGSDADINIATDEPEFSKWQWMTPADITAKIVPFKKHTYTQIFAELGELI